MKKIVNLKDLNLAVLSKDEQLCTIGGTLAPIPPELVTFGGILGPYVLVCAASYYAGYAAHAVYDLFN